MARQLSPLLALALLVATPVSVALGDRDQLVVRDGDTLPLVAPFSNLSLQHQWTVTGLTASGSARHLRVLHVNTFGRVFIDYAADSDSMDWEAEDLAKITVYSNATEMLDIFEAVPLEGAGVELRVKNEDAYARGLIFSKILLREAAALQQLQLAGSADVVVGDNVLGSTGSDSDQSESSISLATHGSGDLDVGLSSALEVDTLDLSVGGSGDLRVNAPLLRVSNALRLTVAGSGDIQVAAESVDLAALAVAVSGSGDIVVDTSSPDATSKCATETVKIRGSGDVDTGSTACGNATIELFGSGYAKVQAVDHLKAVVAGSGDLTYVNALPTSVEISGPRSRKHLRSVLSHGKPRQRHMYRDDASARYHSGDLERVAIVRVIATSNKSGRPSLHIVTYGPNDWWTGGSYGTGLVSLAVLGSTDISVLTAGLGAGAAVGVAGYALLRRRRRFGYAVLA